MAAAGAESKAEAPKPAAGKPVLVTLKPSHYCETARWGLERYGVDYAEEAHAPGFHLLAVKMAGGKHTVPVLKLPKGSPEGTCVDGATAVLRWVDAHRPASLPALFPPQFDAEVAQLCDDFEKCLAPAVRSWHFSYCRDLPELKESLAADAPGFEKSATMSLWSLVRRMASHVSPLLPISGECITCQLLPVCGTQSTGNTPCLRLSDHAPVYFVKLCTFHTYYAMTQRSTRPDTLKRLGWD